MIRGWESASRYAIKTGFNAREILRFLKKTILVRVIREDVGCGHEILQVMIAKPGQYKDESYCCIHLYSIGYAMGDEFSFGMIFFFNFQTLWVMRTCELKFNHNVHSTETSGALFVQGS
jgi:hypothetical protein